MMNALAAAVRCFRALIRRPSPWRESRLISLDGKLIYTVRDRDGQERQILHARLNEWEPISKAQFSMLPCYEDFHRSMFESAVPYLPSPATCSDCGKEIGKDAGPKEGWQLEDGRTVCHACCAADTRRVIGLTVTESDRVSKQATTEEKR